MGKVYRIMDTDVPEMLDYKLAWKGKKLVKVDRFFPSSKKCCKCGRIKKELKLSERVYHCACGNEMDRDRMQQSTSVKKQEGCWQHKLSVSGQDDNKKYARVRAKNRGAREDSL